MSVAIFHCLEPVELIILKKPELNPTFSSLKANFAMPDKIKSYNFITESSFCYARQENNSYFIATFIKTLL